MGGKICNLFGILDVVWVSDTVDVYVVKVGAHFGRHPDVNSQLNYTYMYGRINLQNQ